MKILFEKYGIEPTFTYNMARKGMTALAGNKETVIMLCEQGLKVTKVMTCNLTPDKVLALEEVVFDIQQEDFYQYKLSKGKWCYQWKREYFVKDTRIEALCSLLIYLHQYFNEREIEKIREVLRG